MGIEAAIFDLDGVILDSLKVWDKIDIDFLANRSLEIPDDYFETIYEMTFEETAEYTINRFNLPDTAPELIREWNRMAAYEYEKNIKLLPGAKDYLIRTKNRGIKLAVATSAPPILFEPALINNGILELFDCVRHIGEVGRGKDFPDIYLSAADKLNTAPENCAVFEDSPQAIKSANSVGMETYGILNESAAHLWEEIISASKFAFKDFNEAPEL